MSAIKRGMTLPDVTGSVVRGTCRNDGVIAVAQGAAAPMLEEAPNAQDRSGYVGLWAGSDGSPIASGDFK